MLNGSIVSVLVMRVSLILTVLVDCTGVPSWYHIIDVSCSELLNILPDTLSVPLHDNVTVLSSSTISLGLEVMIISPKGTMHKCIYDELYHITILPSIIIDFDTFTVSLSSTY